MTALLDRLSPDGRTDAGVLAVPAHVDVLALARAWFPDAAWELEPVSRQAAASRSLPLRGARFRGMAVQAEAEPGALRLAPGYVLTGPYPVTAEDTVTYALPPRDVDAFMLRADLHPDLHHELHPDLHPDLNGERQSEQHDRDDQLQPGGAPCVAGSPSHEASRVRAWLVAAARYAHGAVLEEGAVSARVPDAGRSVDRTLYSAHPLASHHALALVRTVLVQAAVVPPAGPDSPLDHHLDHPVDHLVAPAAGATPTWTIATETPYDGTVEVSLSRVEVLPPALLQLPWRDSGPFAYGVRWLSGSPDEQESEHPTSLHLVARGRAAPLVERVAAALERAVEGTVLDECGFVVEGALARP